jgi:uncharacterized protein (DUF697 family)
MSDDTVTSEVTSQGPDRHARAGQIISSAMGWSAASAAIPMPILDLLALGGVQAKMIIDLSRLYGQEASGETARGFVSVLLGVLLPGAGAGALASSSAKVLPGWGTAIGVVSLATLGAAASYAIGKVFVRHFEKGGTIATFDPKAVTEELKEEFAKGKAMPSAKASA